MNLNQLLYADEIDRLGSFSRASQTLYISQSALSKAIRSLEEELGKTLFIRSMEGVTTTNFGQAFLREARAILTHVDNIRRISAASEKHAGEPLRLRVSCGQMLFASEVFAHLLAQHMHDDTDFRFYQKSHSEVFSDVRDGRSDLGILMMLNPYIEEACTLFTENDMEYRFLGRMNVGVAVDRSNPIVGHIEGKLRRSSLENQAMLLVQETLYPFTREEEELAAAFDHPRMVYVTDNDTAISLSRQIPAYFCAAQSEKIYNKLNLPISLLMYPCQNVNLKYEFGWIKKKDRELTHTEHVFINEIARLFK